MVAPRRVGTDRGVAVESRNVFQSSSMVEHAAVNRVVVGSSPTSGAMVLLGIHDGS